uniref:Uncharacterized protein n=1 Tax=Rhizophora mucronata TaxID=61149 RepID=A0A2P2M9M4_RHIMU
MGIVSRLEDYRGSHVINGSNVSILITLNVHFSP